MKKVLIVDDDPSVTKLLATLLEDEGFIPIPITSGQRALDAVMEDAPDIILLDLMMPLVSGSTICYQLKNDHTTKHIPVIVVSGDGRAERKVREIGADDFLLKPFDLDDVVACVMKWCDQRDSISCDALAYQGDDIFGREQPDSLRAP